MIYKPWFLKDLKFPKENAPTVFSCFHCGGGSTMGYKLAGFNVLGGVEIDPKMMEVYRANHNPKHSYLMGVQDFKNIPNDQLPPELFNLDILDGSPPCSSFSMSGSREKAWGKEKKFREGQAEQVLDELFFDFIDIAAKLKPKIVVAENVKGLIQGNAKFYVKKIAKAFNDAGYDVQLFLLNSAFMGVPQRRERTFFIAKRKTVSYDKLKLEFSDKIISVEDAFCGVNELGKDVSKSTMVKYWNKILPGESMSKAHDKGSLFGQIKINPKEPAPTLTSQEYQLWHWDEPRLLSRSQCIRLQSFPDDFNFLNNDPKYLCGMSVPPLMMEKVALEIRKQWLDKIKVRKKK